MKDSVRCALHRATVRRQQTEYSTDVLKFLDRNGGDKALQGINSDIPGLMEYG
jgi:hypothetical protein